jgi:hypothetical protein
MSRPFTSEPSIADEIELAAGVSRLILGERWLKSA